VADRIALEIDQVTAELRDAQSRLDRVGETGQPMRVTPKLAHDTIDELSGLLEHAALDTRVSWVRDPAGSGAPYPPGATPQPVGQRRGLAARLEVEATGVVSLDLRPRALVDRDVLAARRYE
jgi:hypothetical protein